MPLPHSGRSVDRRRKVVASAVAATPGGRPGGPATQPRPGAADLTRLKIMGGQDLDYGPLMADALSQTGGRDRRAAQIEQAKREWELVADSLPQLIFLIGHDTEVLVHDVD